MELPKGVKRTKELEQLELRDLKPYALRSPERRNALVGSFREHREPTPLECRTEYHRDRDRILWSRAFKRLQHKTQVFPHYVEDHYRRRLTHTLEVSQIATTVARALYLNEAATEAIALGHDIGHAPFGHAGEDGLNDVLVQKSSEWEKEPKQQSRTQSPVPVFGFDHCVHAIEVVSRIERDYWATNRGYYGLNLTFDVRDGILKHMHDRNAESGKPLSTIREVTRFPEFAAFCNTKGSLEAQCVYFADKVAYLLGDIEDGIRRGIFPCANLKKDPFIKRVWREHQKWRKAGKGGPKLKGVDDFLFFRRKALAALILHVKETAEKRIAHHKIGSVDDVFGVADRIVWFDNALAILWDKFYEKWMKGELYCEKNVKACEYKAKRIVSDLFDAYMKHPDLVSQSYRAHAARVYGEAGITDERLIKLITTTNYIAGMTDPFAINQHARLFASSARISFA